MILKIRKILPNAELVPFDHPSDAGMDFRLVEDSTLVPHVPTKVRTGVAIEIPEGCVGFIWDKSSIGAMGVKTLGGVVDAGYRGEIFIVLLNMTSEPISFPAGRKIAQLVIQKIEQPELEYVDDLAPSPRGEGGFGSTGK
jgi:dUTP pyrophosphatase